MIEQLDWNDVEPSLQFTQIEQRLLFNNLIDTDAGNEVYCFCQFLRLEK